VGFHDLELSEQLQLARRGTAFFAQRLAELRDGELDRPTLLAGWTRKHLVAHVGYNAVALCRLLDWAATGEERPMYESTDHRNREIAEGATLTAAALRNLVSHTVARLNERWRNLPDSAWTAQVRTAQGRTIPATETAWMRTKEVWVHAVDLDNGGRFGDFPDVVLESLLTDVVDSWRTKELGAGLVLAIDGRAPIAVQPESETTVELSGPPASIVRWVAGRGAVGLTANGEIPDPPRWL